MNSAKLKFDTLQAWCYNDTMIQLDPTGEIMSADEMVRFHLRTTRSMKQAIMAAAVRRGVSKNAWCVWHLTEAVYREVPDVMLPPESPTPVSSDPAAPPALPTDPG